MSNLRPVKRSVNPPVVGDSARPPKSTSWGPENFSDYTAYNNIDTLHFGLFVCWDDTQMLLHKLETLKQQARSENNFEPVPLHIPGIKSEFACHAYGKRGGYAYHVSNADIDLFFSHHKPDGTTPNVFVEIGSVSCWTSGVGEVIKNIYKLIELLGGVVIRDHVNRVDLATDFVGLAFESMPLLHKEHWIRQARRFGIYGDGLKFTGVAFGMGGKLSLRIYDKVFEIKTNPVKQFVFKEVWNVSKYDDLPVTRVEYQLRKEVIKEFKIRTLKALKEKLASLWRYCTHEWFRLSERPVNRNNIQKEKSHSWWQDVQSIKWPGIDTVKRVKEIAQRSLDHVLQQAAGLAMTVSAICYRYSLDVEGIVDFFKAGVEVQLNRMYKRDPKKFENRYRTRLSECWASL